MCDRELNASGRCPAFLHELGRHPDCCDQKHGHDQRDEHLEGIWDVGVVVAGVSCDAEGADASANSVVSVAAVADLVPFVGRVDYSALESVDELGEGDITTVSEHVDGLEVVVLGAVLELDADKVSDVRRRAADELDDQSRSVFGQSGHVGVVAGDLGHPEQRDEGLIGGSDQKELERVMIEGDAL